MGLLQKAIETYDANADLVGVYSEGHDPLAPIGHTLTRADIEITLNAQGRFISARSVDKDEPKILIPVTEESGGRTSKPAAHPLCDNLEYVSCKNDTKHKLYISALRSWAESEYSHPFLPVVLAYAEGGTVIEDLTESGVLVKDKKGEYNEKLFVIWRVIGIDGEEPSCTKNRDLFSAFIAYYCDQISERESDLCMLEGKPAPMALQHPKGISSSQPMTEADLHTAADLQRTGRPPQSDMSPRRKRTTRCAGLLPSRACVSFRGTGYSCVGTRRAKKYRASCAQCAGRMPKQSECPTTTVSS